MYTLERSIDEMGKAIRVLTSEELRQVEQSFRQPTREQILLVRNTLKTARLEQHMPVRDIRFLEGVFERWLGYSLQTKLAAIARVVGSSGAGAGAWPGDTAGDRLINQIIEYVNAAAETD